MQKKAAEKRELEATKESTIQVDDLLTFRQFSKAADDVIDVRYLRFSQFFRTSLILHVQYDEDVGRATGAGEVHEDFISNLSRISQLTGQFEPSLALYISLIIFH